MYRHASTTMPRYRCERRSQIRTGPELDAPKAGILVAATEVEAIDVLRLPSGTTRIHFEGEVSGWVSEATTTGLRVMTKLEAATLATAPAAAAEPSPAPMPGTSSAASGGKPPRSSAEHKVKQRDKSTVTQTAQSVTISMTSAAGMMAIPPSHRIAQHRHGPQMVARMVETFRAGKELYRAAAPLSNEQEQVEALLSTGGRVLELHRLFHDLDIDHAGSVDVEDVAPMIDGADAEAQELIRIADEDSDGSLTFFEFASVYLSAITDGKLGHTSDGFVDVLADVERKVNLEQIASVAEALVKECSSAGAPASKLSSTLEQLRMMLHDVEGSHTIHDTSLSAHASRASSTAAAPDLEALEQFQQELDRGLEQEEALELHESASEEDGSRPMTPHDVSSPGSEVEPVHRSRNPEEQVNKQEHKHQELAKLYGLFPAIDAAAIDSVLEEAGSIDGAFQVLKDVSGATDTIEGTAADAPVAASSADDAKIAAGVEEFPLPSDPKDIQEALVQFIGAQHVNQVDCAWKHVRTMSGVAADTTGLDLFLKLKQVVTTGGRSKALQVVDLLDTKVSRRKKFKLTGQRVCVVGAGPVGLRCAVELAMCGATVTMVEQRRAFTRANILKMWPFLVHDLRGLGAKVFFPQYCTGGLMHIGTRRLQQILLKDCLLLGVNVKYGLQFNRVVKPDKAAGSPHWSLSVGPMMGHDGEPRDPPELLAQAQADSAEIGARGFDSVFIGIGQQVPVETELPSGKQQLSFTPILEEKHGDPPMFELKKVQYSQALGLVTHFQNNYTVEENTIQEQGGIARQFNLEMFDSLQRTTMCELENVVYYRGESHYWVMTPTTESLEKTGVLTKVAPTRDALIAESSEVMRALLGFCYSHINCGEVIDVSHLADDEGEEHGLFDLIEAVMKSPEHGEITKRKLLWRHHIDDSKGSPRFTSRDMALTGKLSAKAQSKSLKGLADDLMRVVSDQFPPEKWPKPPPGSRLFKTHGRKGDGSTFIVDNAKMMSYARNVAGHFRPFFKKKDPATGQFIAQFTSVAEGAQIFNFDQILEAKSASNIIVHDGIPCTINLIGDSLKEPFWPQGTGVNRGILGVFDSIFMMSKATGEDLGKEEVRERLLAERESMQVECFRADTPYEKDGVMVGFKATGKQGGSFTLDPKTRYIRIKHALG